MKMKFKFDTGHRIYTSDWTDFDNPENVKRIIEDMLKGEDGQLHFPVNGGKEIVYISGQMLCRGILTIQEDN